MTVRDAQKRQRLLELHQRRIVALEQRLHRGRERMILSRTGVQQALTRLAEAMVDELSAPIAKLQGQLRRMLELLTTGSTFHYGLIEDLPTLVFGSSGNVASFIHHYLSPPPPSSSLDDLRHKGSAAIAQTNHPAVLYRLRHEFEAWWHKIPPLWRTDTPEGRRHVIHWIVSETLKALLRREVPSPALWTFVHDLVQLVSSTEEAFLPQVIAH